MQWMDSERSQEMGEDGTTWNHIRQWGCLYGEIMSPMSQIYYTMNIVSKAV